jgi:VIT1/CCC1 family predicted Fe2+/Mn2+ transporter
VIRSRVPAWLASGVVGLVSGALLIGLVWPYVIGPLGAEVGVLAVALGGVALLFGGLLTSWASRHDVTAPPV